MFTLVGEVELKTTPPSSRLAQQGHLPINGEEKSFLLTMSRILNMTKEKARRRSLRKTMTEPEIILWSKLKGKQVEGFKFRRQYSVAHT